MLVMDEIKWSVERRVRHIATLQSFRQLGRSQFLGKGLDMHLQFGCTGRSAPTRAQIEIFPEVIEGELSAKPFPFRITDHGNENGVAISSREELVDSHTDLRTKTSGWHGQWRLPCQTCVINVVRHKEGSRLK
jgi:hypothetical protein